MVGFGLFLLGNSEGWVDLCDSTCGAQGLLVGAAALTLAIAVGVTLWKIVRGGTVALVLGVVLGIIVSLVVVSMGLVRVADVAQVGRPGRVELTVVVLAAGVGFALALGAAFRLIARRRATRGR